MFPTLRGGTIPGTIQEEFEQLDARRAERIQQAVERGGLPTEAEADAIYEALQAVFNLLEDVAYRVSGVCESSLGEKLPVITLEDLGVIAVIVDSVKVQSRDFARFNENIEAAVFALDAIRREQQSRAA